MSDVNFERVCSPEQTALLGDLAKRIWNEHFVPIIGQAPVSYTQLEKGTSRVPIAGCAG